MGERLAVAAVAPLWAASVAGWAAGVVLLAASRAVLR